MKFENRPPRCESVLRRPRSPRVRVVVVGAVVVVSVLAAGVVEAGVVVCAGVVVFAGWSSAKHAEALANNVAPTTTAPQSIFFIVAPPKKPQLPKGIRTRGFHPRNSTARVKRLLH